jgi:hypothetical protein
MERRTPETTSGDFNVIMDEKKERRCELVDVVNELRSA